MFGPRPAHLLQAEQDPSDGGAEGHRHAHRRRRRQHLHTGETRPQDGGGGKGGATATPPELIKPQAHLSPLGFVLAVLGEEVTQDVGAAARHVHQGALLAQAEAGGHSQNQRHRLGDQGPLAQVAADDEAAEDGFDLGLDRERRKGERGGETEL